MGSRIDNGDFDVVLKIIVSIASRLFCGLFYIVFYYRRLRCIEYIAVKNIGLMVKCTPERGHNALFFIPLEVIIML